MNLIERILLERYDEFGLADVGLGRRLQTALVTPRFPTSRHVVGLVFAEGDRRPRVVVKIPRRPGDNSGVQREISALRMLAESGAQQDCVPTVLGSMDLRGRLVLVETVVQGVELTPSRVRRDRGRAVAAGQAFVESLPVVRSPGERNGWYASAITNRLAALADMAPLDGQMEVLCEQTHALLEPLARTALPSVFEHGDLSHPNLFLRADGQLGVIDWERASSGGIPGQDLIFFLQYVSESARSAFTRPAQRAAFDDAFLRPDAWARPVLRRHLEARGVAPELLDLLLVATWARSTATLEGRLTPAQGDAEPGHGGEALTSVLLEDRDFALWRHALQAVTTRGTIAAGR